jgi:FkbM family methyltransferase
VTALDRLRRSLFLTRVYFRLARRLENPGEVLRAFRDGRPVPRLAVRGGPTIEARPNDGAFGIFWEVFVERCYLQPGFYRPAAGDTVVDLGANIGVFTLQCAATPGVRIHAVEPAPGTFAQLRRNVTANCHDAAITVHRLAIAEKAGELFIDETDDSGHQQLVEDRAGAPVACLRVDEFFDQVGIDRCALLKVDTEGAEVGIVAGPPRDFWGRVDRLVIEYHDSLHPGAGDEVLRLLGERGYACRRHPIRGYPDLGLIYATRNRPNP